MPKSEYNKSIQNNTPPHKTEDNEMASKINWKPIEEMDLDDGTHTCYGTTDKKGCFVWLTQISDDTWDVERSDTTHSGCIVTMVNCKTLTSAKRWAARYMDI
jgi:hypothetical protein